LTEILPVGAVLLQRADGHTDGRMDTSLKGFLAAMRTHLNLLISPTECIYVFLTTVISKQ